ncbi:unnamed protein product [Chrysoparadoxa australica]
MVKSGGGFQSLGLSHNVFKGVMNMGYKVPTPVQRKSLAVTLKGNDAVVMARTGSGKTAAFLIPLIEKLEKHSIRMGCRGVILSPSRELATQTLAFARRMAKFTDLRFALIVGGDSMDKQFETLADNPDVIIATPGRLMHHLMEVEELSLKAVEVLIFDEADRLFEMGFAEQLRSVLDVVPDQRQTMLFSATMPCQLVQFARAGLSDPALVRLDTEHKISEQLSLAFFTCRSLDKLACLLILLREVIPQDDTTLIFTATRHHAELLHVLLTEFKYRVGVIYGAMDQEARKSHLDDFRKGRSQLLIVTDVAARGIDVPLLNNVVNFSFPPQPKLFVHRVGRAARQGRTGTAYCLVEPEETPYMMDLMLFLGRKPSNTYYLEGEPGAIGGDGDDGDANNNEADKVPTGYSLRELTPDMVHYGCFPQQILDEENQSLEEIFNRGSSGLAAIRKASVANNAIKQYRRTRPEASRRGVERAKQLDKSQVHPLLIKFADRGIITNAVEGAQRSDYLKAMGSFRPNMTIFEVLGGGGTVTKTDVGKVMGDVRCKLRVRKLLETGESGQRKGDAKKIDNDKEGKQDVLDGNGVHAHFKKDRKPKRTERAPPPITYMQDNQELSSGKGKPGTTEPERISRPKLSKAQRKCLKKARSHAWSSHALTTSPSPLTHRRKVRTSQKPLTIFDESGRDLKKAHYIGYGQTAQEALVEEAMQPRSSERSSQGFTGDRLEEAMLDVNPDEALDMQKKQKLLHWDKKKKKFIQTTRAELSAGKGKGRNETSKQKGRQGDLYKKWKAKSNREISRGGMEEDIVGARPNFKANKSAKDEVRGYNELKKQKKEKDNQKLKQMNKKQRALVMKKRKDEYKMKQAHKKMVNFRGRTRSQIKVTV